MWSQHLRICLIAKFCEESKMPKFGTKNALFEYFWARIKKNYCHIWNQHPQMSLFAKFHEKTKMPKFGIKMADLGVFGLEFENNIVIFQFSSLEFV